MRYFSFIMTGLLSTSVMAADSASKVKDPYAALECPKLSLEQAVEIVKSGKMIDAIPHYVAFAQAAHPSAKIDQAKAVDLSAPIEDSDGNVVCEYTLSDADKKVLYELSLRANYGVNAEPADH